MFELFVGALALASSMVYPAVQVGNVSLTGGTVQAGDTIRVVGKLIEAPDGVSGYIANLSITPRSVVRTAKIVFSSTVGGSWERERNDDGVFIQVMAIDLGKRWNARDTDIPLFRLDIVTQRPGEMTVTLSFEQMDADDGADIETPTLVQSAVEVVR